MFPREAPVSLYTYVGNDPLNGTDPSGEAGTDEAEDELPDVVVEAPKSPPPPPPPSATLAEVVVTARAVSKVELAEPFVLNPIGLLITGPFIPGNMGHAACEDSGTCNSPASTPPTTSPNSDVSGADDDDTTTMDSRRDYVPNKPGRKKQGREGGERKKGKPGWKQRNPLREPPKHTPSQKD